MGRKTIRSIIAVGILATVGYLGALGLNHHINDREEVEHYKTDEPNNSVHEIKKERVRRADGIIGYTEFTRSTVDHSNREGKVTFHIIKETIDKHRYFGNNTYYLDHEYHLNGIMVVGEEGLVYRKTYLDGLVDLMVTRYILSYKPDRWFDRKEDYTGNEEEFKKVDKEFAETKERFKDFLK